MIQEILFDNEIKVYDGIRPQIYRARLVENPRLINGAAGCVSEFAKRFHLDTYEAPILPGDRLLEIEQMKSDGKPLNYSQRRYLAALYKEAEKDVVIKDGWVCLDFKAIHKLISLDDLPHFPVENVVAKMREINKKIHVPNFAGVVIPQDL